MDLEIRKKLAMLRKEDRCINWNKESEIIILDKEDYHNKLAEIRSTYTRIKCIDILKCRRETFSDKTYDEYVPKRYRKRQHRIYVCENKEKRIYKIYVSDKYGRDLKLNAGQNAYDKVREHFLKRNNLGERGLSVAFGTTPYEWRICCLAPIYYVNPLAQTYIPERLKIIKCNSIDGCSQYPTGLSGKLPTSDGYKEINGTVKPTSEFPFALYIKSGHVAVYNEFDSHDWKDIDKFFPVFTNEIRKSEAFLDESKDVTILMKESKYSLKEEMEYFFDIKEKYDHDSEEYKTAKSVMNAFIGMLHRSNPIRYEKSKFNHLAAIGIARANFNLLKKLTKIPLQNILHVCVDGIIYKGNEIYGVDKKDKALGKFEQEFYNCNIVIAGTNCYLVKDDDGNIIKAKHGGFDTWKDTGEQIEDREIENYEDLFKLSRTDNGSDYENIKEYKNGKI